MTKNYGNFFALKNVNIKVPKNKIFALLGINGAGKTTTIKILCTLLLPTSGRAEIMGYDVVNEAEKVREIINMAAGRDEYNSFMTPRKLLKYYGLLYGTEEKRQKKLMNDFGITRFADKKFVKLSTGMKQRVTLARSMLNSPEILFLDEPTLGLDVDVAKRVREEIKNIDGTVLLTTHYLKDAEELADIICLIDKGRIVKQGSMSELRRDFRKYDVIKVNLKGRAPIITGAIFQEQVGDELTIHIKDSEKNLDSVIKQLSKLKIRSLDVEKLTLEDIFIDELGGRE